MNKQEIKEPQKCRDMPCHYMLFGNPLKCALRDEFSKKDPIIANAYCPAKPYENEEHKGVVIKYREWGLGGERIVRVFTDGKVELSESGRENIQQFNLPASQVVQLVKRLIDKKFLELPEELDFSNCLDGWSGSVILNQEGSSKKVESKNITFVPGWFKTMTAEIERLIENNQPKPE